MFVFDRFVLFVDCRLVGISRGHDVYLPYVCRPLDRGGGGVSALECGDLRRFFKVSVTYLLLLQFCLISLLIYFFIDIIYTVTNAETLFSDHLSSCSVFLPENDVLRFFRNNM